MLLIRPVRMSDLDRLFELTHDVGVGLTTLPKDREFLRKRIARSERSFGTQAESPGGESYLLVIEDTDRGLVLGTSGMVSKVGGYEPFYAFRIETTVHESKQLKVRNEIRVLHLVAEHSGPCEIGSLFLAPPYRGGDNGRLLSLSRFLFMAENPQRFDPQVLAEIRGVADAAGRSPFWDAVGRHFFELDYPTADYLSVVDKRFIAELMPKHPIYIPLLPAEAQGVVGKPHEQSAPAMRMLESEGFRLSNMVDIFDAGPVVTCPLEEVRVVRESRRATVAQIVEPTPEAGLHVLTTVGPEFRACRATITEVGEGAVHISTAAAATIGATVGTTVRYAPLRPRKG